MNNKTNGVELAVALATANSRIGNIGSVAENTVATGVYEFLCRIAPPHLLAEYIETRDAASAAEDRGDYAEAARLLEELRRVPQEECWRDVFCNTVLTAGKNDALDKYLAGSSYTAAFYLGLISNASYSAIVAGDTAASHAGWTESVAFSNSTRVAAAWASASAGSKALSAASVFNINGTDTIKGAFLATNSTKSGTSGVFYSAGLFTGGDQPVVNGNTLSVSYTASL